MGKLVYSWLYKFLVNNHLFILEWDHCHLTRKFHKEPNGTYCYLLSTFLRTNVPCRVVYEIKTTLNMTFIVTWYLMSLWQLFGWHFLRISLQILLWMVDDFIPLAKLLPFLVNNFVKKYCHGWFIFGWEITQYLQQCKFTFPQTRNDKHNVGDNIRRFAFSIEQDD